MPSARNRNSEPERIYRAVRSAGLGRAAVARFIAAFSRSGLEGVAALDPRVAELLEIELRHPGQIRLDPHGRSFRHPRRYADGHDAED
jgi:hypothetical protein